MTTRNLRKNFSYRLIGSKRMQKLVISTLQKLPEDIQNYVSMQCWFIGSFEEGWAFVLRGDDIKGSERVIFLSDELLSESDRQVSYTIAHEIAHVVLRHRNSISFIQDKKEVRHQERQAHEFVKKYLPVVVK